MWCVILTNTKDQIVGVVGPFPSELDADIFTLSLPSSDQIPEEFDGCIEKVVKYQGQPCLAESHAMIAHWLAKAIK